MVSMTAPEPSTRCLISDEEVAQRVLDGETALYEVIMRRYNLRLYRVARAILRDDGEAEDVMQEAYVRAFQHLDQFAGEAKFSTWLTKIAVYEALRRRRMRDRLETQGSLMEIANRSVKSLNTPDPEQQAMAGELRRSLESAVDSLPDAYRSVFVFRSVEEMTVAETAACLEISEEAVKTRLHRARALIRRKLSEGAAATAGAFEFPAVRCDRVVAAVLRRLNAAV